VSLLWVTLFLILIIIATLAIWSFSLESRQASSLTSNKVLKYLETHIRGFSYLERAFGFASSDRYTVQHAFRKLAHFVEYALFGMISQCLLAALRKMKGHYMLHLISLGLLVALVDETIQIGVDRGAALTDVWLDFTGVLFGCCIVWMIYGATRVFARK
jgi:VanZ family protein